MEARFTTLFFITWITAQAVNGDYSLEETLLDKLTDNYGDKVAPKNCSVSFMVVMRCVQIYPSYNLMNVRLVDVMTWSDDRLTWNPKDYGGRTRTTIPSDLIWTPYMIYMLDSMAAPEIIPQDAVCYSNGTVTWRRPTLYKINYIENKNNTEIPFLGHLRYGALSRTVEDMNLSFLKGGFINAYMDSCRPYVVTMYRTRSNPLTFSGEERPVIEVEFVVQKLSEKATSSQ